MGWNNFGLFDFCMYKLIKVVILPPRPANCHGEKGYNFEPAFMQTNKKRELSHSPFKENKQ
jgi:hypothetical protein